MQPGDLQQQSLGYQQAEEEQLPEMMQHEEHQQEYVHGGESRCTIYGCGGERLQWTNDTNIDLGQWL
ncbi:unnamed protein product [Cuscuta campestris]|uniref:Uncharacterized protein n=1 Tax=Cuscuta campestris TaxID=132261 RepID=A0A484KP94_9ASTE|nr:unnamed protein product [Cuscuta campestris]